MKAKVLRKEAQPRGSPHSQQVIGTPKYGLVKGTRAVDTEAAIKQSAAGVLIPSSAGEWWRLVPSMDAGMRI